MNKKLKQFNKIKQKIYNSNWFKDLLIMLNKFKDKLLNNK